MGDMRNSRYSYGSIARALHWTTAVCFLAAYCAVYYRQWFTVWRTPENVAALQLHLSFGISIGVLTLLRIVWTVTNTRPDPEPGSRLTRLAARTGHLLLYGVLITMPITGYLSSSVGAEMFSLVDVPRFEDTRLFENMVESGLGMSFEEWETTLDFIHKSSGAYLVWPLVLGHAGAALYHHYGIRDRTLVKMAGRHPSR